MNHERGQAFAPARLTFRTDARQASAVAEIVRAVDGPTLERDAKPIGGMGQSIESANGAAFYHQVRFTGLAGSPMFIRFWLTTTVPLPDSAMKAAQAMGRERWERFVESLALRMEAGPRLKNEIAQEVGPTD